MAWQGRAWLGMARQGGAWQGLAWQGEARQGMARQRLLFMKGGENMKVINVTIQGVTPLLYNRFRDSEIEGKSKKRTGSPTQADVIDKLYMLNDKPYIPAVYFRNSLVEAGKQFKITGKGKSTYSKIIASTVEITPEAITNDNPWEVFRIAAVNPMTKGRMMVSRPRMNTWGCKLQIVLNDDSVDPITVKEVLEHAGKYVGIGDWRPQTKGVFGKYMVTRFEESK
ncbi:MAG: hypothetical protein ACRDFB_03755 [Rhabdochlamydiaceae bacterium]